MNDNDLIVIGLIKGKHGIKCLIIVKSYTENADGLEKYNPIFMKEGSSHTLKIRFKNKDLAICYIEGVNNPEKAELLKGQQLCAKRYFFPELDDNEY